MVLSQEIHVGSPGIFHLNTNFKTEVDPLLIENVLYSSKDVWIYTPSNQDLINYDKI